VSTEETFSTPGSSEVRSHARHLVVVGGSAGSVEALIKLVGALPGDFPAAVLIAMHVAPEARSMLPRILTRAGPLPAEHARDGERIEAGRIYIAPPDHHLLVTGGHIHLSRGPRENGHRPAADPLFRSAAHSFGPRVTAVVLSGGADDGAAGLVTVKELGGVAVAQDPHGALHPSMPESAIDTGLVDEVLDVSDIWQLLVARTTDPVPGSMGPGETDEPDEPESRRQLPADEPAGRPSSYTCPECHGTLFEVEDKRFQRYRCRIGHAYSPKSLEADQAKAVEDVLWTAVRALEERQALLVDIAQRLRRRGSESVAGRMEAEAADAQAGLDQIRNLLAKGSLTALDHDRSGR